MTTTKAICVWLDETTDFGASPAWIVSRDTLDEAGQAETTSTLSTHETEQEAIDAGRAAARKAGLPLYRNPADGPAVLIEAVAAAE